MLQKEALASFDRRLYHCPPRPKWYRSDPPRLVPYRPTAPDLLCSALACLTLPVLPCPALPFSVQPRPTPIRPRTGTPRHASPARPRTLSHLAYMIMEKYYI